MATTGVGDIELWKGENMKKLSLIVLLISLLFLFGCAKETSKSIDNLSIVSPISTGDANEKELFRCGDEDNEYYCVDSGMEYKLCHKNKATGEVSIIRKEDYISCLTFSGSWVYYAANSHEVCRVGVTGTGYSKLLDYSDRLQYDGDDVRSIYIMDGVLFARQQSFPLFRFDTQTRIIDEISANTLMVGILEDSIYYNDTDFTVYRMNAHDEKPTVFLKSEIDRVNKENSSNLYKSFLFLDGVMYYYKRSPDGLYSNSNGESIMIDDNSFIDEFSLNSYNSKLYYVVRNKNYQEVGYYYAKLMCYNPTDGVVSDVVYCDDYASSIRISEGVFYYFDKSNNERKVVIE